MADEPSAQTNNENSEQPAPEVLVPRAEENGAEPEVESTPDSNPGERPAQKRATYRPSHRATFIGLAVVVAVLAINAIVIAFVIKSQSKSLSKVNTEQVTISQSTLDKLGVNRSSVGDLGALLTVGPNAQFNGDVTVGKDVSISGQLKLNSKFTAIRVSGKNRVGPFDILPGHADFFSVMSPGEITIETKPDEPPIIFKLTSGIVSVRNNQVALFVNI